MNYVIILRHTYEGQSGFYSQTKSLDEAKHLALDLWNNNVVVDILHIHQNQVVAKTFYTRPRFFHMDGTWEWLTEPIVKTEIVTTED